VNPEIIERARREDRAASIHTRVYFIQEDNTGAIKIGSSKNVKKRVIELRTGTSGSLTILAVTEGGLRTERVLQSVFSHARIHGEWFRPVPELIEYAKAAAIEGVEFEKREREALFEKVRNTKVIA
jgi:hypothetical protein